MMSKIINMNLYKKEIEQENKLKNIKLRLEDKMEARKSLICDDDDCIIQMIKKVKEETPNIQIPFLDMIFDKEKRQTTYKKYDKNYEEIKDEEDIFKQMTIRRLKYRK